MVPVQATYDPDTDQLVIRVPAANSDGDVELARLDMVQFTEADIDRLSHIRDPSKPAPSPLPSYGELAGEVQGIKDRAAAKAQELSPSAKEVASSVAGDSA